MKSRNEVAKQMLEYIDLVVQSSNEDKINEFLTVAKSLAWVIGATDEDVNVIYDGKVTEMYIAEGGAEA